MAIPNEIRSKYASQHHNATQKILIKTIPFDTEIIAQFKSVYRCLGNFVKNPEAEGR